MSEYTPETKAAVMAALLEGQSVHAVAREYKIPRSTVTRWKNSPDGPLNGPQKTEIGELLIEALVDNIKAEKSILSKFQDATWQHKQDASSLGVLYGILKDKQMRMLEALSKSDVTNDNSTPD